MASPRRFASVVALALACQAARSEALNAVASQGDLAVPGRAAASSPADSGQPLLPGFLQEPRVESLRTSPVRLERDRTVLGVAWLEGRSVQSLAVFFAPFDGSTWGPAEQVAGPGPGSQTALAGAALSDGSAVLAWSRYDGEDDEIFWSRREPGGRWSPARRAHQDNSAPDITPTLAAVGKDLLLAWSRFEDGEYRVVLARLGTEGFLEAAPIGPPGAGFPFLKGEGNRALLLLREFRSPGWSVVELDRLGSVLRWAHWKTLRAERPGVESLPTGVRLHWEGETGTIPWHPATPPPVRPTP